MDRVRAHLPTWAALAFFALAAPAASAATPAATHQPTFPIPASERVHGTAPATTVPATPAGGVTPGAAPATTTPAAPAAGTTAPATTTPGAAPATTPAGQVATPAGTRRGAARTGGLSTGAAVAAALAALLIVLCLAWGTARWFAYEPRWVVALKHSLAEAGWRLSASWDEFSDWTRLGR